MLAFNLSTLLMEWTASEVESSIYTLGQGETFDISDWDWLLNQGPGLEPQMYQANYLRGLNKMLLSCAASAQATTVLQHMAFKKYPPR